MHSNSSGGIYEKRRSQEERINRSTGIPLSSSDTGSGHYAATRDEPPQTNGNNEARASVKYACGSGPDPTILPQRTAWPVTRDTAGQPTPTDRLVCNLSAIEEPARYIRDTLARKTIKTIVRVGHKPSGMVACCVPGEPLVACPGLLSSACLRSSSAPLMWGYDVIGYALNAETLYHCVWLWQS